MTLEMFNSSLKSSSPPGGMDDVLKSLWWDKKGDWDFAHSLAQSIPTVMGSAVHAYLHRREGVQWNAEYWYQHAGRKPFPGSLEDERESLLEEALNFYRQDLP